jgi:tetratricopeptide (TPR) repeat protein
MNPVDPARRRLEERRDNALRDLEELTQQVEEGEIDAEAASRLEEGYRAELAAAEEGLAALPEPSPRPKAPKSAAVPAKPRPGRPAGEAPRRLPARGLAVIAAVVAVLTVAIVFIARSPGEDETASPAESTMPAGSGDMIADLEAAVAANPGVNEMRLALAELYFNQFEFAKAKEHYLAVLHNSPTPDEQTETMLQLGLIEFYGGDPELAAQHVQVVLDDDPGSLAGRFYLGAIQLYGLEDPAAAIETLEGLVEDPELPDAARTDAEGMLTEARSILEEGEG